MCLGVPAQVMSRYDDRGTPMATVDFGGVTKSICLSFAPEAAEGDYVIVHAGCAIAVLDEEAAKESLDLFEQMGILE